jgi:putative phage-type endonuclease
MEPEDRLELIEQHGNIALSMIFNDISKIAEEKFIDNVKNEIKTILTIQLQHLYNHDIENDITEIIKEIFDIIHNTYIPKRSYLSTFIIKKLDYNTREKIKQQILYLRNVPQPEQRTSEWYEMRHNLITASNAWKAFHTQSSINQLIYEKCEPINTEKFASVNVDSPFHWGQKYEPVSVMFYEEKYNTKIEDFGCIPDINNKFLGVSPDGINVKYDSDLYGRMLEIKNPISRIINGIPKREYWIQMQLQMSVCGLNECDFLETSFKEYNSYDEFITDGNFNKTKDGKQKGIMLNFLRDQKPIYEYAPLNISESEYKIWEAKKMKQHIDDTWIKNIYYYLHEYSCVLVLQNMSWFNYAKKILSDLWNIVLKERVTGYEHRAPKKRIKTIKKYKENDDEDITLTNCMINLENI